MSRRKKKSSGIWSLTTSIPLPFSELFTALQSIVCGFWTREGELITPPSTSG